MILDFILPLFISAGLASQPDCSDFAVPDWSKLGPIAFNKIPKSYELIVLPQEVTFNRDIISVEKKMALVLQKMILDAKSEGVELVITSGFRSNDTQKRIVETHLKQSRCPSEVFRSVAPPGYSTHALGRALDFYPANASFRFTRAYEWLKKRAAHYGFQETYFKGNPHGVAWEPWHYDFTSQ